MNDITLEFITNFIKENKFKNCNNEEELRQQLQNELNLYARKMGITNTYINFRNENNLVSGRTDFVYGNSIIEFKTYDKLSSKHQLESSRHQLFKYLTDIKYHNLQMYGFLFDGVKLESYVKDRDNNISPISDSNQINVENVHNFLNIIFNQNHKIISPWNIQNDFAILTNGGTLIKQSKSLELLRSIYRLLTSQKNQKTELLYLEWEKLFKLSEKDQGKSEDITKRIKIFSELIGKEINRNNEYQVLFSLHTTLNIIIKLLLVKSTNYMNEHFQYVEKLEHYYRSSDIQLVKKFLIQIESGKYFRQINILNLVDSDFFSWYLSEMWDQDLLDNLKSIMLMIDKYTFDNHFSQQNILADLFRGLYENFIPKVVRHSFGEYHTPSYLVKFVLASQNIPISDYRNKTFIDPCCGSGTFILELYNHKIKNYHHKIDFQEFLNGIVGVDVNPISSLISKANIFINAINKVTFSSDKNYEIPIYNCDSLYIPEIKNFNGVNCYYYSLYTSSLQRENKENIELILPVDFVERNDFF